MALVESHRELGYEPNAIGQKSARADEAESDETLELEGQIEIPPRREEQGEEAEQPRITRLMAVASFKLDIKLQGTENYEEWLLRIQTAMLTLNYNRIMLGEERETDVPRGTHEQQRDWRYCFSERRLKAHHMLVEHIAWNVLQRFQTEVRSGDPTQLWRALRAEFGSGGGLNTVYILRDIYNRYLQPNEKAGDYIADLLRLRRVLRENGETMEDQDLADVMLSNAVEVYPGLAREHGERKCSSRAKPELRDATARLENAELIANNMPGADRRGGERGGGQGLGDHGGGHEGRAVNYVQERGRSSSRGRGRGGSRARSSSTTSSRSNKKSKRGTCFRCGSDKHFVRDCPQPPAEDGSSGRRSNNVKTLNVMLTPHNATELAPDTGVRRQAGGEGSDAHVAASGSVGGGSAEAASGSAGVQVAVAYAARDDDATRYTQTFVVPVMVVRK